MLPWPEAPFMPLDREEYIEQAYFFQTLRERMQQSMSTQDLLDAIGQEVLATTMLRFAIEFMAAELRLTGGFATAMARLPHYFTPFQTYVVAEAEKAEGRFDFRIGLEILQREAEYRAKGASVQGIFLYQFESLCRNRLGYERGLDAVAADPSFDDNWREWIVAVRRQLGLVDVADMIYVRSELYRKQRKKRGCPDVHVDEDATTPVDAKKAAKPILFGEKEGQIALANRHKDPLYLFAALQRHLGYPAVPQPRPESSERYIVPELQRRIERLETRMGLLEEEYRGGINLSRFYSNKETKGGSP
jgi:hypothetical protein